MQILWFRQSCWVENRHYRSKCHCHILRRDYGKILLFLCVRKTGDVWMKDILFSIIVTIYNVEEYLDKCVESIKKQTYSQIEIILVDDGSEDQSGMICDRLKKNDDRIKVIHQKNQGIIAARSRGILEAKGDYVVFVDADDWVDENMCKLFKQSIDKHYPDFVLGGLTKEYLSYSQRIKNVISAGYYDENDLEEKIYPRMIYTGRFFEKGLESYICAKAIKKNLILNVVDSIDKEIGFAEGGVWLYSCMLQASSVDIIDEIVYHYRLRSDSMTIQEDKDSRIVNIYETLLKNIVNYGKDVEQLIWQLDHMIMYLLIWKDLPKLNDKNEKIMYPYLELPKGCKVIIYGAWRFGRELYAYIQKSHFCEIVLWVDQNAKEYRNAGLEVDFPEKILEAQYDYIILGTALYSVAQSMRKKLLSLGISEKILYIESSVIKDENLPEIYQKVKKKYCDREKKIILFGAGKYGRDAAKYYGLENILCFIDNNCSKWGDSIFSREIFSPDKLEQLLSEDNYRIIITSRFFKDIASQLENMGILQYEIYSGKDEKRYFPTSKIVVNPYENDFTMTEEKWNFEMRNNPKKQLMRAAVNELFESVPLFNHIEIETINRCNGICSFCPVNINKDTRERKVMSWKLFKKIVDELKKLEYTGRISLFSNNEPMLDERIIELYQYARENLPKAWLHMFTNGTLLTLDKFKKLIPFLDELIIDNYNQELNLIPNCKVIKEYCGEHPELLEKVTIVLRKPNEVLTSRGGDAPNRVDLVSYGNDTCILPFKQMIVRPDGKVSLCCNDPLGKNTLGDLSKEDILDVWYGEKFRQVRKALYIGRKEWKHCLFCDVFNLG